MDSDLKSVVQSAIKRGLASVKTDYLIGLKMRYHRRVQLSGLHGKAYHRQYMVNLRLSRKAKTS